MASLMLLTLRFIRHFPHLLIIVGCLTAGPMVNTDDPAASFPNLFAPIAVVALGVVLSFVLPLHGRRRQRR